MKKITALITIMLVAILCLAGCSSNAEKIAWEDIYLGSVLPKPQSLLCEIYDNSEESLYIDIHKISSKEFVNYIDLCKSNGFTIEPSHKENAFDAYNSAGFKLSLYYYEDDKQMQIQLDAPEKYDVLDWSAIDALKLLPVPQSDTGKVEENNEKATKVYVAEMTTEKYQQYVNLCIQNGFDKNINSYDKTFTSQNVDGYRLTAEYVGNNVVSITIQEPEYEINLRVERVKNLIFSTYDVDIYVDDNFEGTVGNGLTETYTLNLTKGTHTVDFVNAEDSEVYGQVKIDVSKNEDFAFQIYCYSSNIDIETVKGNTVISHEITTFINDQKIRMTNDSSEYVGENCYDVEKAFKEKGFINIEICPIKTSDNSNINKQVTSVSINNDSFKKGDEFKVDDKIIIYYWQIEQNNIQILLPPEDSKLGNDFDSTGKTTVFYVNVDGVSNKPTLKTWKSITVTDGVAEYLDYLESLGYTISVTDTSVREPYEGFYLYEHNFNVSKDDVAWTMYLNIQDEKYVEYEFGINLQ
ncbi:MAG: hypothetical protein IKK09_04440 [Clostridia bacterium]|nr:hypothetical protein [Clostridia bacterium]